MGGNNFNLKYFNLQIKKYLLETKLEYFNPENNRIPIKFEIKIKFVNPYMSLQLKKLYLNISLDIQALFYLILVLIICKFAFTLIYNICRPALQFIQFI